MRKPPRSWMQLGCTLALVAMAGTSLAAPPRDQPPGHDRGAPPQRVSRDRGPGAEPPRWVDRAHGHERVYPAPGWVVPAPPQRARILLWGGVHYRFVDGVWYAPSGSRFVVVHPPVGIVISGLPPFYTVLTIGGIAYWYANGVYYREHAGGGYEVAPAPGTPDPAAADQADKLYVYPRRGQTAEQQAKDEYECHRWAADQTGFDPVAGATGQRTQALSAAADYRRAQAACLEGRGYTTR